MLVDDADSIRHCPGDLFASHGFQVIVAGNGREALLLADQIEAPLSAVITDQTMPEMDGWLLLRDLRLRYGTTVPVVLLSATSAQAPEAWTSQFDAFFT